MRSAILQGARKVPGETRDSYFAYGSEQLRHSQSTVFDIDFIARSG